MVKKIIKYTLEYIATLLFFSLGIFFYFAEKYQIIVFDTTRKTTIIEVIGFIFVIVCVTIDYIKKIKSIKDNTKKE